jgi:predicted extracellular nuclease
MADDGASGDGAAADGVYGALLPVTAVPGQSVAYYVAATATNAYLSVSYLPELTERAPLFVEYALGSADGMRITEWMYSGASGEFIELTNTTDAPVDMTDWSFDDDHAVPGAFDLSGFGVVQPGESVIITESLAEDFRTAWGLSAQVKVIGQLGLVAGNNLGRADQIHLYNTSGLLVDRLFYGDQTYAGTIRTQNRSGQAPCASLGQNDIFAWQLATVGDSYGSFAATSGDIGTPGSYNGCASTCTADFDDSGDVGVPDIFAFLSAWFALDADADFDGNGSIAVPDIFAFLSAWFAGCD